MSSYFYEWFIPLVKRNYKQGDILIHLGDVFDSRQSISLKVLNLGISVFEELSLIFTDGIYVMAGNHDVWNKTSNDINSLKSIKWIPNVNIIEEPLSMRILDKNFLLMPWRKDHEAESEFLEQSVPHDVLCCHADIRGLKFNKFTRVETGASVEEFDKFKKVYSGHIHYAQKSGNVNMLGSPYEITRSDMDNQKGVTLLNVSDLKETYFPNDFSPKFKRFYFTDILESTQEDLEPLFANNFVDIMIDPIMSLKAPLNILTDILQSQRSLKFHPYDPDQANSLSQQIIDIEGRQFNVLDFIKEYIENLEHDRDTKDKMYQSLVKLHTIVTTQEQENK
jgi:DNA repair exonuclease SbcCD nuclease subunit